MWQLIYRDLDGNHVFRHFARLYVRTFSVFMQDSLSRANDGSASANSHTRFRPMQLSWCGACSYVSRRCPPSSISSACAQFFLLRAMPLRFAHTTDRYIADLVANGTIANKNPLFQLKPSALNITSTCWATSDIFLIMADAPDGEKISNL